MFYARSSLLLVNHDSFQILLSAKGIFWLIPLFLAPIIAVPHHVRPALTQVHLSTSELFRRRSRFALGAPEAAVSTLELLSFLSRVALISISCI